MEVKVFQLDWGTGHMELNVGVFFTTSKAMQMKKFCKLAKRYSSEEERMGLLAALAYEDDIRKALLEKLGELSFEKVQLANNFFHTAYHPETGWAEKRLLEERAQLKKSIETLSKERWD